MCPRSRSSTKRPSEPVDLPRTEPTRRADAKHRVDDGGHVRPTKRCHKTEQLHWSFQMCLRNFHASQPQLREKKTKRHPTKPMSPPTLDANEGKTKDLENAGMRRCVVEERFSILTSPKPVQKNRMHRTTCQPPEHKVVVNSNQRVDNQNKRRPLSAATIPSSDSPRR